MRAFVLRQNLEHFERLLAREQDAGQRRTLENLLAEAKRELAALYDSDPTNALYDSDSATARPDRR